MILGREAERALLSSFLEQITAGAAPVLVLEGPVGIGKTTLLAEARAVAVARQISVRSGGGLAFQEDLSWRAGAELFGRPLPGLPDPIALVAAVIADLRTLTQPTLILVDDADRLDPVSAAALTAIVTDPPAPVLGVLLGGEIGGWPLNLETARSAARVDRPQTVRAHRLGGLDREAAATLLDGIVPAEYLASVHLAAVGNPFLLGQVRHAGVPVAELVQAPPSPDHTYVSKEFDRCSVPARQLASAGAVLGDPFPLDLAASLADQRRRPSEKAARELLEAGILIDDGMPGEYRFRHPLLRIAAYERPIDRWRAGAHATAARELSERGAPAEVIAHHWGRSAAADPDSAPAASGLTQMLGLGARAPAEGDLGAEMSPGEAIASRLLDEVRTACAGRRWDTAVGAAERLQVLVDDDASPGVQVLGARARAEIALAAGDLERAEAEILLAARFVRELGGRGMDEIQSLALRVDAATELGSDS